MYRWHLFLADRFSESKWQKKAGIIGGFLIGIIVICATLILFARVATVKDAQIPMLVLVQEISPVFATVYALIIFALIFNTAFSLFYSLASRLAKGDRRKMVLYMAILTAVGYVLSFAGFKQLISSLYPLLGYLGMILLVVLLRAWFVNQKGMKKEQKIRRKMFSLAKLKLHPDKKFGKKSRLNMSIFPNCLLRIMKK